MKRITQKLVESLKPRAAAYFERDERLKGFGVKVMPTGRVSFIVEGRIRGGRTRRLTLGSHPALTVIDARNLALKKLQMMQMGEDPKLAIEANRKKEEALGKTLEEVFESYLSARDLKVKTLKDYQNTFNSVFAKLSKKPIRSITRGDVEELFIEARDQRGLATASKAYRMISSVFNFAKAEEVDGARLIVDNPADVIKEKRFSRTIKPRDDYLDDKDIGKLIHFWLTEKDWPDTPKHGVTEQGINYVILLMCSGLRRSEGMRLRWEDVDWSKDKFVVRDTKNGTDHYVPISKVIKQILDRQKETLAKARQSESSWVFPASRGSGHMTEPKSQLARIVEATGVQFRLHDLRRTFATHAQANGVSYDLIKRALNHKSKSVTDKYIITQVDALRPVFDAVADGYHTYYDPDWEINDLASDLQIDAVVSELPF